MADSALCDAQKAALGLNRSFNGDPPLLGLILIIKEIALGSDCSAQHHSSATSAWPAGSGRAIPAQRRRLAGGCRYDGAQGLIRNTGAPVLCSDPATACSVVLPWPYFNGIVNLAG